MSKNIAIIGGGISGLSVLHHLREKYSSRPDVEITLFEKNTQPGGTIRTIRHNRIQFEIGPNGFLDSKSSTLQLVKELALENELIAASPATKKRYICVDNKLHSLPTSLLSFLQFQPLTLGQKTRILKEIFIAPGIDPEETIHQFGVRRLGEGFAKFFLDPMVSGIFGGDAKQLNLKYAIPRIYEIEQTYGSLFKGMIQLQIKKRKERKKNSLTLGQPTGQLWSFKDGMGRLTETLAHKHAQAIINDADVTSVTRDEARYILEVNDKKYSADHLILSTPAYAAANLVKSIDPTLSQLLDQIAYASIAVVGLLYDKKQFSSLPLGFGYLRPSHENKDVLGVLFSSQIYPLRCGPEQLFVQVMLGGAHHPEVLKKSDNEIFAIAEEEIRRILNSQGVAQERHLFSWDKAIPQYNRSYPQTYLALKDQMKKNSRLYLLANYLDGISLNDCTENSKRLVREFNIDL